MINLCRREKTTSKINIRFFGLGSSTKHRVIAAANIDNPKFEVVLLPTVGASSFLHDFLDRYLFCHSVPSVASQEHWVRDRTYIRMRDGCLIWFGVGQL